MTKPDALERLREKLATVNKQACVGDTMAYVHGMGGNYKGPSINDLIIACAEVVEDRLMKECGVRVTKVLRQLSIDFRSVVEGSNE